MEEQKKKEAPKCVLRWEEGRAVVECDTVEDRDRAVKALEEGEVIVRVKVKKEDEETK